MAAANMDADRAAAAEATAGSDREECELRAVAEPNGEFQWDDSSQLYFHQGSGLYHDPVAGWYYNTKDGLYYALFDGEFVLWDSERNSSHEVGPSSKVQCSENQDAQCNLGNSDSYAADMTSPPSQWLEETLINLYLSGYSASVACKDDSISSFQTKGSGSVLYLLHTRIDSLIYVSLFLLESESEDAWQGADDHSSNELTMFCGTGSNLCLMNSTNEDLSDNQNNGPIEDGVWDEENWRAQYGQVVTSVDSDACALIRDLWDWHMEEQTIGKKKVARLVGRIVKKALKLHPSIPSGNTFLRTSCICETHLDLVRVETGHLYRLKNPSSRYMASVSIYDSSNPTKDWGFPDFELKSIFSHGSDDSTIFSDAFPSLEVLPFKKEKKDGQVFRDRAAERRALHGGFGIGPGQKNLSFNYSDDQSEESCEDLILLDDANDECRSSLGVDSYGRRVLQSMGWHEGEGLGKHNQGLLEPLQPVGNKGNAGLGWGQMK